MQWEKKKVKSETDSVIFLSIQKEYFMEKCSSFSKNKDSLAMWNYYSKGNKYEGFNIGVYPNGIKESLKQLLGDKEAEFHIYPVIYSRSEQKRLIEKMLIEISESNMTTEEKKLYIKNILKYIKKNFMKN